MVIAALTSVVDWSTFWPAFIATAAGVILGIPAGILLNSVIGHFNGRKARAADTKRLSDTILAVTVSLDVNDGALTRLQEKAATSFVLTHGFDLATWDMAKSDVQRLVKPIEYRIPLAQYFEDVRQLLEIIDSLNSFSLGANSALISAPTTRQGILEGLQKRIPVAIEKGQWLRSQIVELEGLQTLKHPLDPVSPIPGP